MRDDRVERLDLLHGQPQVFLLAADIDRRDQRLAAFEQAARLTQHLGKHRHLERSRSVRELDKREAVAARRGSLLLANYNAGEAKAV